MVDDFPLKIYFAIIYCVSKKSSTFQFYIFEILIFHKNFKQEKYGKNSTWGITRASGTNLLRGGVEGKKLRAQVEFVIE